MTISSCLKKTVWGDRRKSVIFCILFAVLLVVMNYAIVRPWEILPIDAFVVIQVIVLMLIILLKVTEMVCCFEEDQRTFFQVFYFVIGVVFITATSDGFMHEDLSF